MVNFYHKGTTKGSRRVDWVDPITKKDGFGYPTFAFVRARLASVFSKELGILLMTIPTEHTEEHKKMLSDIRPYVPEECCPMFCQYDCEGELTAEQCAKIVKAYEGKDILADIEHYEVNGPVHIKGMKPYVWKNDIINVDRVKTATKYFFGGIRHAAEKNKSFIWH